MKPAYNTTMMHNLHVVKEVKRWVKPGLISIQQFKNISAAYPSDVYHPNFIIRILLFIATILAISGITGLLALFLSDVDQGIFTLCLLYGLTSFLIVERIFIQSQKHFKSGVNEAIFYHACLFTILGISGMTDFQTTVTFITTILVLSFAAVRYLDVMTTLGALISFASFLFYECFQIGGIYSQIIPLVFIMVFCVVYFLTKLLKNKPESVLWKYNLTVIEAGSLILIYAAGNYFVVREMSITMMGLVIVEGDDMPFAFLFYVLTSLIPILYIYFGIKKKDVVLLRISLAAIAFSVFTFKYYFSLGHPEITLTLAGIVLIAIAIGLLHYLKTIRFGFTRENLLHEKWANANLSAFVVSQTLPNAPPSAPELRAGGGEFGGGGATGNY